MMTEKNIRIAGMSCHHCVAAVRSELEKIPSLEVKAVEVGSALVTYDEATVKLAEIAAAIEEAGYSMAG
jgi:copper chaperone